MTDSERTMLEGLLGRLETMEIKGISIDSRKITAGELFIAIKGDRFDGHDFVPDAMNRGAWGAVVERAKLDREYRSLGTLRNIVPVENTLSALQEMSHLHRKKFTIPLVGITGSNGKTTTKEMLAGILKRLGPVLKNEGNLNNHIGVPLTLLKLEPCHRAAVVEMGMSAPGEIDLLARIAAPGVGVITNAGPAHLEFLGSVEKVAEAKAELLGNLQAEGTAVLNADDRHIAVFRKKWEGRTLTFGIENTADVTASDINQDECFTDFSIAFDSIKIAVRLRAVGRYNVYNALAAAAAAYAAGMSADAVKSGIDEFEPVAMRSEIRRIEGRTILADYYNANPGSVQAALETLVTLRTGAGSVAVLGDMLELGEGSADIHREIGRSAVRLGVGVLIALGPLSGHILEGALEAGMSKDRLFAAGSHAEAADLLKRHSKNGDAVLIKGSRGMKMEKILEEF